MKLYYKIIYKRVECLIEYTYRLFTYMVYRGNLPTTILTLKMVFSVTIFSPRLNTVRETSLLNRSKI